MERETGGEECCRNCKFYWLEKETIRGHAEDEPLHPDDRESECRRYPPVRGDAEYYGCMVDADVLRDYFSGPIVQSVYWCGEWRPRHNHVRDAVEANR